MAWFPHEPIDAVTCCILSGLQGAIAQQNGTKETITDSREQSEIEAAFEKNTGSLSWTSSYRKIRERNHQQVEKEWYDVS